MGALEQFCCQNKECVEKGRVNKIEIRTVFGTEEQVQAALKLSKCSRKVNTSFIERQMVRIVIVVVGRYVFVPEEVILASESWIAALPMRVTIYNVFLKTRCFFPNTLQTFSK